MSKLKKIQATSNQDTNSLRNAHVAADLCYPATCIDPDMRNNEVYAIFERDPSEQILPVIENQQIVGLINRERFMGTMAGRFHWEVYSKKRCKKLMEHDPVVIDAQCSIVDVAERLLGGGEKHVLADCFIIARSGVLLGTGYTRDVLAALLFREQRNLEEMRQHSVLLTNTVRERTRELEIAKNFAERANRAKSEFLSNMSHEFKTPLHAVLAMASLGKKNLVEASNEKLATYFFNIQESALRLNVLVNDLIDVAQLEAGQVELKRTPVDLRELILSLTHDLVSHATKAQVQLLANVQVDEAVCFCDGNRIRQVLAKLMGNAIKYSARNAQVIISLELIDAPATLPSATIKQHLIKVSDQGPGIPAEEFENIFEPFVQSTITRTGAGGSGLGLPISREIIRLHGGDIEVANLPQAGACFSIRLPAAEALSCQIAA